jgi:hypothetical protein
MKLIGRYNQFYNDECAASPWGGLPVWSTYKQRPLERPCMPLPVSMV